MLNNNDKNPIERQSQPSCLGAVIRWVAASEELPPLYRLGMSRDVLTLAGSKMSVKSYDYELGRWNGSPHITVKYWMELPEPPCV